MLLRDEGITLFKAFLVWPMIFCHVLQFFLSSQSNGVIADFFMNIINIQTFSAFIFAFGYITYKAYLTKPFDQVKMRLLKTFLKQLLAFYVSGIAFRCLAEKRPLTGSILKEIIWVEDLPGWSEFLIAFALFTLITFIGFKGFNRLLENKKVFWIVCILLLGTAFIPYQWIQSTQIGVFIGMREKATFPVVQYMVFYIVGMYANKYDIKFKISIALGSLILTCISFIYSMSYGLPNRFPPSILWIIYPSALIYFYYILSKLWNKQKSLNKVKQVLIEIGDNTLFYLLMSNVIIFACKGLGIVPPLDVLQAFVFSISILGFIYYLVSIIRPVSKRG